MIRSFSLPYHFSLHHSLPPILLCLFHDFGLYNMNKHWFNDVGYHNPRSWDRGCCLGGRSPCCRSASTILWLLSRTRYAHSSHLLHPLSHSHLNIITFHLHWWFVYIHVSQTYFDRYTLCISSTTFFISHSLLIMIIFICLTSLRVLFEIIDIIMTIIITWSTCQSYIPSSLFFMCLPLCL